MSIKKISDTKWEREYPCGDWNAECDILATKEGLVIDYDLITWNELEKAKEIAMKVNE